MAVQILDQGPVCDGYDVAVRLADGRLRRVHFAAQPGPQPADALALQAACEAFEAELLSAETAREIADNIAAVATLGATATITFVSSTVAQNVAALRVAFLLMRAEQVCRTAEFLLRLTDAQIKSAFSMEQTQCDAFQVRLAAKAASLQTMLNQVGE
jgi:hypothetical protein